MTDSAAVAVHYDPLDQVRELLTIGPMLTPRMVLSGPAFGQCSDRWGGADGP